MKKTLNYFLIDLFFLFATFTVLRAIKTGNFMFYANSLDKPTKVLFISWLFNTFLFGKYNFYKEKSLKKICSPIIYSGLLTFLLTAGFITFFRYTNYSPFFLIELIIITSIFELIGAVLIFWVKTSYKEPEILKYNSTSFNQLIENDNYISVPDIDYKNIVLNNLKLEDGDELIEYIKKHIDLKEETASLFILNNINLISKNQYKVILNYLPINHLADISVFFETVNAHLQLKGVFICFFDNKRYNKTLLKKDNTLLTASFPDITNEFFKFTSSNKKLSKVEILGRMYASGFKIIDEKNFGNKHCFVVSKISPPLYPDNPTHGPLIKLKRIAKGGKKINVYKFRTMYPYSEFLQEYIYSKNGMSKGDKAINDYRVTPIGKFMRTYWIDEIPMIYNLIKGDIKLVGVRPLSVAKFQMYPKDLQEKRILYKPGLIPPFYADMPKSFEEHIAAEKKYLNKYINNPLLTDIKYFFKALFNILFKNARSM